MRGRVAANSASGKPRPFHTFPALHTDLRQVCLIDLLLKQRSHRHHAVADQCPRTPTFQLSSALWPTRCASPSMLAQQTHSSSSEALGGAQQPSSKVAAVQGAA